MDARGGFEAAWLGPNQPRPVDDDAGRDRGPDPLHDPGGDPGGDPGHEQRDASQPAAKLSAALTLEAFRLLVAEHLRSVAVEAGDPAPGAVIVNLASHQIVDDLRGWGMLNQDAMRPKP